MLGTYENITLFKTNKLLANCTAKCVNLSLKMLNIKETDMKFVFSHQDTASTHSGLNVSLLMPASWLLTC